MKKIEAIIRPEKLEDVLNALESRGCSGLMITDIEGYGKQKGMVHQWRGEKYKIDTLPKVKLEAVVKDSDLKDTVKTIVDNARTGDIGDGKIFIHPVENSIRIRTGEEGEAIL